MLPKERRIPRAYFPYILSNSKKSNSQHLMLYTADTPQKGKSKFCFSVSKKVSKSAVGRNKLRRRGYAVIAKHIISISDNKFFFFVYKKDSNTLPYSKISEEIKMLLSDFLVIK
jgi:ribonuclease P protein component